MCLNSGKASQHSTEQESTQGEPESFIPDEDQESFAVPKKGPHPILQVRIPFSRKAPKAAETFDEESTTPKDTASEDRDEVVTISDENGTSQDGLDPSSSQSTEVPSRK